jgi:hypothetical protein
MANDKLATLDQAEQAITETLQACNVMALKEMPTLRQAIVLAHGVTALRKALTDQVMSEVFMPLQGSALGFQTDKDRDGGYPVPVVRDCVIEALIHGFQPVGNELNIIAGRFYGAKNGFARKVREFPGLTDLHITPGVPLNAGDKGSLVPMTATWRVSGAPYEMVRDVSKNATTGVVHDTRIPVRVNSGMGVDAVVGKATRKMLKAIYDLLTGSTLTIEDGEVGEAIPAEGVTVNPDPSPAPAPPEQDGRKIKLGGNGKNPPPSGPPPIPPERDPGQEG